MIAGGGKVNFAANMGSPGAGQARDRLLSPKRRRLGSGAGFRARRAGGPCSTWLRRNMPKLILVLVFLVVKFSVLALVLVLGRRSMASAAG